MQVIVTGGAGFLGQMLARRLGSLEALTASSGELEAIDRIILLDSAAVQLPANLLDHHVELVVGDVTDASLLATLVDRDDTTVFHLASMVSFGCELDFDAALAINLDGTRVVLEALRARDGRCRLVFASSIAAFGGASMPDVVGDATKLTPETTYGMTKAICELLVNDYSRKGYLDGRSARLPTVVVRPGRPNAAASSWVSGIFREPLNGEECVVPVEPGTRVPLSGYRTVVENLVRLHEVPASYLGDDRALNLPALAVDVKEMTTALHEVADGPTGRVVVRPDPAISAIFRTWAQRSSFERATRFGLVVDESLTTIVRAYVEDFLRPGKP